MVIVTKPGITEAELDHIRERVEALGLRTHVSRGAERTIVGCIGDEAPLREAALLSMPGVETVIPVVKPYKLASRDFVASPTVVQFGLGAMKPFQPLRRFCTSRRRRMELTRSRFCGATTLSLPGISSSRSDSVSYTSVPTEFPSRWVPPRMTARVTSKASRRYPVLRTF